MGFPVITSSPEAIKCFSKSQRSPTARRSKKLVFDLCLRVEDLLSLKKGDPINSSEEKKKLEDILKISLELKEIIGGAKNA